MPRLGRPGALCGPRSPCRSAFTWTKCNRFLTVRRRLLPSHPEFFDPAVSRRRGAAAHLHSARPRQSAASRDGRWPVRHRSETCRSISSRASRWSLTTLGSVAIETCRSILEDGSRRRQHVLERERAHPSAPSTTCWLIRVQPNRKYWLAVSWLVVSALTRRVPSMLIVGYFRTARRITSDFGHNQPQTAGAV